MRTGTSPPGVHPLHRLSYYPPEHPMVALAPAASEPLSLPARLKRFFALDLLDNRYPALHGLRFFAIVTVIQFHVTWIYAGEQKIPIDEDFMNTSLTIFFGMDLFFMLSGFLIGSILLHSLETKGKQQIRRFYLRRIFRTFPSYYVVLTALALATTLTVSQRAHLKFEYMYLTNFLALGRTDALMFWGWSLAVEEQFYLTVPLLFFLLYHLRSDRQRVTVLASLWSLALVIRLYIFLRYRPWGDLRLYEALYFHSQTRFDTLVAGILLAVVHRTWKEPIARWLTHPFHRALLAIPSLACLWLLLRPWMFGHEWVQTVHVFAWGTVTTLMYFGALLLLLHTDGPIQRALSAPVFRRLATLGYGVYLVHIPLIDHVLVPAAHALDARHVPMLLVWPLSLAFCVAASLAVAYMLHVFIEKPSLRIREWLAA